MEGRGELLQRLKRLNPAQFEEVLFRLGIDPAIIPSPFAEQSLRAIRVIQRLEQESEGVERLNQILAESAISIIGEQYIGYEIEAQVKGIVHEYLQQPFEGREDEQRQLDEFVQHNSRGVLLVTGAAGFGKSALLSHWQQTQQEDCFIAYHCFSYRYQKTRSVSEAYRHLLKQLYLYHNIRNGQFPNEPNRMRDILVGMLEKPVSPEGKRLVIVLDGLDEASETLEPFFTRLPDGVFVIASARAESEDEPEYLRNWTDNAQRLYLKRLRREAIPKWLGQIRELVTYSQNQDFVQRLDEITGGFPLYLRYLIDELRQAAIKRQDVQGVLRNSPGGFKAYVKEQFRQLAQVEEIKRQREVRELFALLSVALGALSEDDIEELTELNAWDLADLPWQATRWFSIQTGCYSFAHPLLAQEFKGALGRQAGLAENKLIDYCAKWQELERSDYGLRYYAEHLGLAKRWQELYELARNQEYVTAQRQHLPEQPDLPLKTVQIALSGAAETDDAGGMAEFLLVHAERVMQIAQESPLDILRLGSIDGALALAEKFEPERCVLWYLLLAWELAKDASQDGEKREQAREILERLQQKNLPRLSESWMKDFAVYWLTYLLTATKGSFTGLSKRILGDDSLANLCQNLVEASNFSAAIHTAQQIKDSYRRAKALVEIAKAQAQAGNFTAAIHTAQQIEYFYFRAKALVEIAKAQPTAENFTAAIHTAQQIEYSDKRELALVEIAKAQAQAENFTAAIHTAQQIDPYSEDQQKALVEIAKAQAQAGNFTAAIHTAQQIDDYFDDWSWWRLKRELTRFREDYRAEALLEIAKAQAQAENFTAAIHTAQQIEYFYFRAKALLEIAKAQPTAENFTAAIHTAQQIKDSDKRAKALVEIAKAQAQAENFTAAIHTAQQIGDSKDRAKALAEIAKAQPTAKNFTAAIKTAQQIKDSDNRELALAEIAKAQPTPENFTAAIHTAQQIKDSKDRAKALVEIATAQAQAENFTAAIHTAQLIEDSYKRAEALVEIAKAQPTAENFTAAIHTAQQIKDSYLRAEVLVEIVQAQAQAENFTAAIHTAQQIKDSKDPVEAMLEGDTFEESLKLTLKRLKSLTAECLAEYSKDQEQIKYFSDRAKAMLEIAKAQPTAENFSAAIHTAQQIEDSYDRALVLVEIVKAQAQAEKFTAAIHTAQQIGDSKDRAKAMLEIAKAQPTPENFTAAIHTAQQIEGYYDRELALREVAKAQVENKCIEQALLTAEKILMNRNEHLPDIAATSVKTGDKENFKRLLIPCAYYLDAAYKMCGHLAQLYPNQLSDIAKIVNTFTLSST
ncbi:MAG: AAA family ATPase [Coleofasciculus sp. C1-SOL-03]|uniref:AAA family ATPase n=1 Tax=Coleofasciculus sp. C1-SOL-03 TaxID=3069522 RepID=UPI003300F849